MRFYFLETVREFAREKLIESGEDDAVRERHLLTHLQLAETANDALLGPDQEHWLHRLEQEHDNFRAALSYAVANPEAKNALRLGSALCRFWQTRGYLEEGTSWVNSLLSAAPPPGDAEERRIRARANNYLGTLLTNANRFDEAKEAFRTAIDLFGRDGAKDSFGPLNNLGLIDLYNGDYASAHQTFARCLDILGKDGDPKYLSSLLNNRGMASLHQGDQEGAEQDLTAALYHYRQIGNTRGIAKALSNLGALAVECDAYAVAEERFRESLTLHETLRDFEGAAICHLGLAGCAMDAGKARQAASFFGKAEAIRSQINAPVRPVDQARYENLRTRLRNVLGEEELRGILDRECNDWSNRTESR
jgi:tetratricopeptide (TPR) repeat protein